MASAAWQTPGHLIDELVQDPFAFDFFRALRRLEASRPDLPRIGFSDSPAADPLRFGQRPSLSFPPSTLEELEQRAADLPPKLYVRCFGLFGPNGPLPTHLTEYAYDRELHDHDSTLRGFADIFHHRLISFFYRAWAANQKAADLDRAEDQRFAIFIGSLFGMGMEALQKRDDVQDLAKLFFSGRLVSQARNAEGLEAIVGDYFGIKTQILTFVGCWIKLPENSKCQIGTNPKTGVLGESIIVGSRSFEAQLKFRIRLGPMGLKDYERMLPKVVAENSALSRLRHWVLAYCGEQFFWDLQLVLIAAEVPETHLGDPIFDDQTPHDALPNNHRSYLGWNTWLKSQPCEHNADNLILIPPD
jgi:type VI secretion system protein ImpH